MGNRVAPLSDLAKPERKREREGKGKCEKREREGQGKCSGHFERSRNLVALLSDLVTPALPVFRHCFFNHLILVS